MIDRLSRRNLAQALRQYVSGRVSNDDLADCDISYKDRGVKAVYEMAWGLYDDNHNHHAKGAYEIRGENREAISRWICFLHSDFEYEWPEYSFIQIHNLPMNILTLGLWEIWKKKKWKEFESSGDFEYWPFFSKVQHEHVMRTPTLLNQD